MEKDERGIALNVASSAEWLLDDAQAYSETQSQEDRDDLIASMRVMVHRIRKALKEMGEEEDLTPAP